MQTPTHAHYTADHPAARARRTRTCARLVEPYQAMIVTQFRAILDRTERSEYYPWIDTKINLITGEELPPAHPLLGRDLVSGWVQGRGLESVAKFAAWLAPFRGRRRGGSAGAARPAAWPPTCWRSSGRLAR